MAKALGLLSGGLDSIIAVKILLEQGIEAEGIMFTSPLFFDDNCREKSKILSEKLSVKIHVVELGKDYISNVLRKPKHGYGSGINPCIDCKIFMLKKSRKFAEENKFDFIFTGEVLDQRPMSQHRKALDIIEKESGLKGKLLRPLSARLLPETEAEKNCLVDRNKLLGISGRSRHMQLELAKKYNVDFHTAPAGGCSLTNKEFALKVKDLLDNQKNINSNDIQLLRNGRQFRLSKIKIIVGKDEKQNKKLLELKKKTDTILEPSEVMGPITLIRGKAGKKTIEIAASITARYCDSENDLVKIKINDKKMINSKKISEEELKKLRIIKE